MISYHGNHTYSFGTDQHVIYSKNYELGHFQYNIAADSLVVYKLGGKINGSKIDN